MLSLTAQQHFNTLLNGHCDVDDSRQRTMHVEITLDLFDRMNEVDMMHRLDDEDTDYPNMCLMAHEKASGKRVACFSTEDDLKSCPSTLQFTQLDLNKEAEDLFGMSQLTMAVYVFFERTCPGMFSDFAAFTYDFHYNDAEDFRASVYCTRRAKEALVKKFYYDSDNFL